MVKNPSQGLIKTRSYLVEILQCQFAVIKLTIREGLIDYLLNSALYARRRGIWQRPYRSLHHIRQHDKACLLCLRPWAGVAEILLLYIGILASPVNRLLLRLVIEIGDKGFPVMLLYDVYYLPAQLMLLGQFHALLDMGYKYQVAHGRGELIVPVFTAPLVFYKVKGLSHLSYIMIIGADLGKQRIGFNCLGRSLNHAADYNAVMICT